MVMKTVKRLIVRLRKRLWLKWRRTWRMVRRQIQARPYVVLPLAILIIGLAVLFIGQSIAHQAYVLSDQAISLISQTPTPVPNSPQTFSYDRKQKAYFLNQSDIKNNLSIPTASSPMQIGQQKSAFSASLPHNFKDGMTYYDNKLGLSLKFVPQFSGDSAGSNATNHVVYPIHDGRQAVYTTEPDGVQEDIIFNHYVSNTATFTFRLDLPAELAARQLPGGSVGIYSAESALYGNVSASDAKDRALLEKARKSGQKNNLDFVLVRPIIRENGVLASDPERSSAAMSLNNNILTITASGLSRLKYPITIDPSVLLSSAPDFATNGVSESNSMVFDNNGGIYPAPLTSGQTGNFSTDAGTGAPTVMYSAAAAWNTFTFTAGGCTAFASGTCSAISAHVWQNPNIGGSGSYTDDGAVLGTAVYGAGAAVYDGYLYVYGGCTANASGNCSAVTSTLQSATISGSGALGSFSSSTPTGSIAMYGEQLVAYHSFLYVIGGCTVGTASTDTCSTFNNNSGNMKTQYTPINGDGTVGSFTTTATGGTPAPRFMFGATAVNGYMYIADGCVANGCSAANTSSDVESAPINSSGTVGSWTVINANNTSRFGLGFASLDGYLYVEGGCTGISSSNCAGFTNTGEYATMYPDGTIGPWIANGTMVAGLFGIGLTNEVSCTGGACTPALNTIGGCASMASGNCTLTSTNNETTGKPSVTQSTMGENASVKTAANNPTLGVAAAADIAYNGFLYAVGGCPGVGGGSTVDIVDCSGAHNGVVPTTDIQFTQINQTTGDVGSWNTTTTALPTGLSGEGAFFFDNRLYVVGGWTGASLITTISRATIGVLSSSCGSGHGPGDICTAFATVTATVPVARAEYGLQVWNGYVYIVGGCKSYGTNFCASTANITNDVYQSSRINTSTYDIPNSWTSTTLPWSTIGPVSAVNGNYLYVGGGCTTVAAGACSATTTNFDYASLSASNGNVGTWTAVGNVLPTGNSYGGEMAITNSVIYFHAGCATTFNSGGCNGFNSTEYYNSLVDGQTTNHTWTNDGTSFGNFYFGSMMMYQGYEYMFSGYVSNAGATHGGEFSYPGFNNGGPGTIGSWVDTLNYPFAQGREELSATIYNGFIYSGGGFNGSATIYSDLWVASINLNGSLASWTQLSSNSLPQNSSIGVGSFCLTAYNGYLYTFGGDNEAGTYYNASYYMGVSPTDGTALTNWTNSGNNLPVHLSDMGCVAYNGYLYSVGGWNNNKAGGAAYDTVAYKSQIQSSGAEGTWASTGGGLSVSKGDGALVVNNSANPYLFFLGGNTNTGTFADTVEEATINTSTGALSSFTVAAAFHNGRAYPGAAMINGFLYVFGGENSVGGGTNDDQTAWVGPTGLIGPFQQTYMAGGAQTTGMTDTVFDFGYASTNGRVYAIGGLSSGTALAKTQGGWARTISNIGEASKLITFDASVTPYAQMSTGDSNSTYSYVRDKFAYANASCTTFPTNTNLLRLDDQITAQVNSSITNFPSSITDGCSTVTNVAKYLWFNVYINNQTNLTLPILSTADQYGWIENENIWYRPSPTQ